MIKLEDVTFGQFIGMIIVWILAMRFTWVMVHHHDKAYHWGWWPFFYAVISGPVVLALLHLHRKLF